MKVRLSPCEHYTELVIDFENRKDAYYLRLETLGFITDSICDFLYLATDNNIDKFNYLGKPFDLNETLGKYFSAISIQQNEAWFYFDDELLRLCNFKDIHEMEEHISSYFTERQNQLSLKSIKFWGVGYVGE